MLSPLRGLGLIVTQSALQGSFSFEPGAVLADRLTVVKVQGF